jgi:hypothetical protein
MDPRAFMQGLFSKKFSNPKNTRLNPLGTPIHSPSPSYLVASLPKFSLQSRRHLVASLLEIHEFP